MILDTLPLVAGILSLLLGLLVVANGTSKKGMKLPFALFAGSVGLWAIGISLFSFTNSEALAQVFVSAYYVSALFIAYGFLLFSLYYLTPKVSPFVVVLALVPLIVMAGLIVTPFGIIESILISEGGNSVTLVKPIYVVYALMFVSYTIIGLGYLWLRAARDKGQDAPKILALALTVCMAGGAYFNLILPWLGNYSLIALGPLFSFIMVVAVFYVIARHGLFDIRAAVLRTVTYVLSLATLAAVYLVIAFIVFDQLLGQTSNFHQTILNVALTLLLAFLFQPVKRFFDKLTNRLFFKDSYDPDVFYGELNKTLTSTTDLKTLLRRVSVLIAKTLKSEQVSFFVYNGEHLISSGTDKYRQLPLKDIHDLADSGEILRANDPDLNGHLRRVLLSHRLIIAKPIMRDGVAIGLLSLGHHLNSNYTHRDVRILNMISDELVIAIQNALSVQEVKDLNANLEQRIDAATKELRMSNAQLQRLDEAKDEFISMASHQLRTPLTSIKGYISMIIEGDVGKVTPQQKHLLGEAFMSSERMVRLIGDFLSVSRLQTGKFIIEKHEVNIAKLIQQEVDSLAYTAQSRGLTFEYKQPKNIPLLQLDENKIQQVVMNFMDNAMYYSKSDGGAITIQLKKKAHAIEFTVKDTGIGVPKEEQAKLFSKFFRAENARRQRPDGTGVGLYLAKKVIDAHDGEVIFSSKEGKGSVFGFSIPIKK